MNQLFRYLSLRWNIPRSRITLRQPRQPFEMLRSYEDWSFDKVHSYNYPNEFRIVDLLPKDKSTVQLLYQIKPCRVREVDETHVCSHRSRCKVPQRAGSVYGGEDEAADLSSSGLDDDLSSSGYLIYSDEEDEENEGEGTMALQKASLADEGQQGAGAVGKAEQSQEEPSLRRRSLSLASPNANEVDEEKNVQKDVTEIIVSIMGLLIIKKQEKVLSQASQSAVSHENMTRAEMAPFPELSKQELAKLSKLEQRDYHRRKMAWEA